MTTLHSHACGIFLLFASTCTGFAQGTYTCPFTPTQTSGRPIANSQDQGLVWTITGNGQPITTDLASADYYILHAVFNHGPASFAENCEGATDVSHWNILLGVYVGGEAPEEEFLSYQPYDAVVDLGVPFSYLTDDPLTTVAMPGCGGSNIHWRADSDYGVTSAASLYRTNTPGYFIITGQDAISLRTIIATNPSVLLVPYNSVGGGAGFFAFSNIIMPGDTLYQTREELHYNGTYYNTYTNLTVADRTASFHLQGYQYPESARMTVVASSNGLTPVSCTFSNAKALVNHRLEYTTSLEAPQSWMTVTNFTTPSTSVVINVDPSTDTMRIFRLRSTP